MRNASGTAPSGKLRPTRKSIGRSLRRSHPAATGAAGEHDSEVMTALGQSRRFAMSQALPLYPPHSDRGSDIADRSGSGSATITGTRECIQQDFANERASALSN